MGGPTSGRFVKGSSRKTSMFKGKPGAVNPFHTPTPLKTLTTRVKRLENAETHKYKTFNNETLIGGSTFSAIPLFKTINGVTRGTLNNQMIGSSIHQTGIALKYFVHNVQALATYWRMAIVVCKNGNEITVNGEDIFLDHQDEGVDFNGSNDRQQLYLSLNRNKYTIIYDKIHKLGAKNSATTDNFTCNKMIKFYKSYKGKKVTFDSNGNPNERMYLLGWPIDANLDVNNLSLEITGTSTYYYKDY